MQVCAIPLILRNRSIKEHENIQGRGESESGRDLKNEVFTLICPKCTRRQNCAKNKFFTTVAVSLSCKTCKTNTTSTQWHCTHGQKWHTCSSHREAGMRCGSLRTRGTPRRPDPLKAEARLFQKAKKLGPLGSCPHSSPSSCSNSLASDHNQVGLSKHSSLVNSTKSPGKFLNQKNKKENGSYGGAPTST